MNWLEKLVPFKQPSATIPANLYHNGPGIVLGEDSAGVKLVGTHVRSILVIGPCGVGKTTGIVVPTLLNWPKPALVLDLRGDVRTQTGDARAQYGDVCVLNPECEDTWTFEALPPSRTHADCMRLSEAMTSAMSEDVRSNAQDLVYRTLLRSPPKMYLHDLKFLQSSPAARALSRELRPLQLQAAKHITSQSSHTPHTLYVQGTPWNNPELGLLARLAAISMPRRTLHLLDDSRRYGFDEMTEQLVCRVVTVQDDTQVGQCSLYEPRLCDAVVCMSVLLRESNRLLDDMGVDMIDFQQSRLDGESLIRFKSAPTFRAGVIKPWRARNAK